MIKAIFFDIDGTLVSFKTHKISQQSVDSINQLRKKGIKTFIATGRHLNAINNVGTLQFDGYVTINGGLCLLENKEVIYRKKIDRSDIEKLVDYIENIDKFPVIFVCEEGFFINYYNDKVREVLKLLDFPDVGVQPIQDAISKDILQVIAFFNTNTEASIMSHLPNCDTARWHPAFTDIVPKGSSKDVGIDKMIAHFGIDISETMAFGDGGNDISMLRHVHLGVAMENANDEVKKAARYITSSVDDEGISKALKHFGIL